MDHSDHSHETHAAKCDACDFVATTHAHDDGSAVVDLSNKLAEHNREVHNTETNPAEITDAVQAKMQKAS